VPELSAFEVEMAIENLVRTKLPGTDQIPAELMRAEGRKFHAEIHKLINSIRNKEELPEVWKGDKTDCSNYRGISLLSDTFKMVSNILLSMLTPYAKRNYWGTSRWISTLRVSN
jgi:hypothetical protein